MQHPQPQKVNFYCTNRYFAEFSQFIHCFFGYLCYNEIEKETFLTAQQRK